MNYSQRTDSFLLFCIGTKRIKFFGLVWIRLFPELRQGRRWLCTVEELTWKFPLNFIFILELGMEPSEVRAKRLVSLYYTPLVAYVALCCKGTNANPWVWQEGTWCRVGCHIGCIYKSTISEKGPRLTQGGPYWFHKTALGHGISTINLVLEQVPALEDEAQWPKYGLRWTFATSLPESKDEKPGPFFTTLATLDTAVLLKKNMFRPGQCLHGRSPKTPMYITLNWRKVHKQGACILCEKSAPKSKIKYT